MKFRALPLVLTSAILANNAAAGTFPKRQISSANLNPISNCENSDVVCFEETTVPTAQGVEKDEALDRLVHNSHRVALKGKSMRSMDKSAKGLNPPS